jgi:hypothetical protein
MQVLDVIHRKLRKRMSKNAKELVDLASENRSKFEDAVQESWDWTGDNE